MCDISDDENRDLPSSSQCSPLTSVLYEMKPWIQKAWADIVMKVCNLCQLAARGIRVGQAGKRWLQASTFDEESHAAVAGAVAELAKPTT